MGDETNNPSSPVSPGKLREEALKKQYQRRLELQQAYRQKQALSGTATKSGCSSCGKGRRK